MEICLKRSTLLFFTVVVAAKMTSGQGPVMLRPVEKGKKVEKVKIPFGSHLKLFCNLNTTGFDRFRMNWYFNVSGHEKNLTLPRFFYNTSTGKDDGQDNKTFDYTPNATYNNSGFYYCKVHIEIPSLRIITSAPTEVVITTVSPKESFPLWWLWIILGVSAVILSILLLMFILLRRRCRQSREEPIYANTHSCSKQPSPRMPMDNLKMVPSSQNLRNPSPGRRYDEGKRRQRP